MKNLLLMSLIYCAGIQATDKVDKIINFKVGHRLRLAWWEKEFELPETNANFFWNLDDNGYTELNKLSKCEIFTPGGGGLHTVSWHTVSCQATMFNNNLNSWTLDKKGTALLKFQKFTYPGPKSNAPRNPTGIYYTVQVNVTD